MTSKLWEILEKEFGIPGNAVYVSYWGTANWGWKVVISRNTCQ